LTRRFAAFLPVFAVCGLLFGLACSGDDSDDPTPGATQAPTDVPATSTPEPTATPAPYNGPVVRFMIPEFGVDTPVEVLGVTPDNYLDTPANPLNTGWYGNGLSDVPGWNGNAVFSAHYNQLLGGQWHDGPFKRLKDMQEGDEIVVVMGDGTVYRYAVVRYQRYEEATFPTGDLLDGAGKPADEEWITLITCGGRTGVLDANGVGDFLDRDVVIARKVDNQSSSTS